MHFSLKRRRKKRKDPPDKITMPPRLAHGAAMKKGGKPWHVSVPDLIINHEIEHFNKASFLNKKLQETSGNHRKQRKTCCKVAINLL